MDIFDVLSLILAIGFLIAAFFPYRIQDAAGYRRAITLWIVSLTLYFPVSALFQIGVFLSFVARPVGFILALLSLRALCLALCNRNN